MITRSFKTLVLAGCMAAASALTTLAQPADTIRITVPFAFSVGSQKLSAGEYTVGQADSVGLVVIRGAAGQAAAVMTISTGNYMENDDPGLVFERKNGEVSLAKVRLLGQPARLVTNTQAATPTVAASKGTIVSAR